MREEPAFCYDPFSTEAMTDPQPFYRRLRQDFPAYPLPRYRSWRYLKVRAPDNDFSDISGTSATQHASTAPLAR